MLRWFTRIAIGLLLPTTACGPDCVPTPRDGEVTLDEPQLLDDGEVLQLQYRVRNGTGAAVYAHDAVSRVLYDDGTRELALTLAAPTFPDDIHVFGAELCYRKVPAGCACEVRREVYREYTQLTAGEDGEVAFLTLPVHESEQVDLIIGWGDVPLEPEEEGMSRADYDTWRVEVQDRELTGAFTRSPGEREDGLPEVTESTACTWIIFP